MTDLQYTGTATSNLRGRKKPLISDPLWSSHPWRVEEHALHVLPLSVITRDYASMMIINAHTKITLHYKVPNYCAGTGIVRRPPSLGYAPHWASDIAPVHTGGPVPDDPGRTVGLYQHIPSPELGPQGGRIQAGEGRDTPCRRAGICSVRTSTYYRYNCSTPPWPAQSLLGA